MRPPALDNARLYLPLAPRDHKVAPRARSSIDPIPDSSRKFFRLLSRKTKGLRCPP